MTLSADCADGVIPHSTPGAEPPDPHGDLFLRLVGGCAAGALPLDPRLGCATGADSTWLGHQASAWLRR